MCRTERRLRALFVFFNRLSVSLRPLLVIFISATRRFSHVTQTQRPPSSFFSFAAPPQILWNPHALIVLQEGRGEGGLAGDREGGFVPVVARLREREEREREKKKGKKQSSRPGFGPESVTDHRPGTESRAAHSRQQRTRGCGLDVSVQPPRVRVCTCTCRCSDLQTDGAVRGRAHSGAFRQQSTCRCKHSHPCSLIIIIIIIITEGDAGCFPGILRGFLIINWGCFFLLWVKNKYLIKAKTRDL